MVTADSSQLIPSHLKLVQGPESSSANLAEATVGASSDLDLGTLGEAFSWATGWQLAEVLAEESPAVKVRKKSKSTAGAQGESNDSTQATEPRVASGKSSRRVSRRRARRLASEIGHMADLLHHTQDSLRERESELATAIPFVSRPEYEASQLALRLEAILCGGAQAVDCPAAALYLLDDATNHLKLRSQWGLTDSRFLMPPRQLREAKGDVEALAGHAVVIEDTSLLPHWNVPEPFPAAVCIPVASATVPLGTMWVFSTERRDFLPKETNLLEIVAGRLAAELEREVLLRENESLRRKKASSVSLPPPDQQNCPRVVPLIDGWEIAGTGNGSCENSNEIHEWYAHEGGGLSLSLARALDDGLPGALTSAAVGGALRAHRDCDVAPDELAQRINQALWTGSTGDQWASLFHGTIEPNSSTIEYVMAGAVRAFVLRKNAWEEITPEAAALGVEPTTVFRTARRQIELGEAIILTVPESNDAPISHNALPPAGTTHLSAAQIVELWRQEYPKLFGTTCSASAVLVAKRTR